MSRGVRGKIRICHMAKLTEFLKTYGYARVETRGPYEYARFVCPGRTPVILFFRNQDDLSDDSENLTLQKEHVGLINSFFRWRKE